MPLTSADHIGEKPCGPSRPVLSRRELLAAVPAVAMAAASAALSGCASEGGAEPEDADAEGENSLLITRPETPVPATLPDWVDPTVAQTLLAERGDPVIDKILTDVEAVGAMNQKLCNKLLKLAANDPASRAFVYNFRESYPAPFAVGLSGDDLASGGIPLLMQWDTRWGYTEYIGGPFGTKGCCPTCMSMIYAGLTRKTDISPFDVGQMVIESGLCDPEGGTYGEFVAYFADRVGFWSEDVPNLYDAADYLDAGYILVCNLGVGSFTDTGHYVLITGHVGEEVRVRDPYTASVNDKTWPLHAIVDECESLYAVRMYD